MKRIPTYSCDGRRLRDYSLAAIERLLSLSLVIVRRSAAGVIRCALFRGTMGSHPCRRTALGGQRYSFLRRIGEHSRIWDHKELPGYPEIGALIENAKAARDAASLERFVRAIFLAVPLSVLSDSGARTPVVSIETGRRVALAMPERLAA